MRWRNRAGWAVFGRALLVCLLVVGIVVGGEGNNAVVDVAAILCGAALLAPRLPWFLAPLLVTAAAAWWPSLFALLLVALYDMAVRSRARVAVACSVLVVICWLIREPWVGVPWWFAALSMALPLVVAVVVGLWLGSRRRLLEALDNQVQHLKVESDLREAAARDAERSRIATEMHDVLAHRLSLIALHTGVLATRGETLPTDVTERLQLLRTSSTEALADLRDVLGALRDPEATAGAPLTPVLRDVEELVEEARVAGQNVEAGIEGHVGLAPTTHRLAAFRIVQEALTNARKHAAGGNVTVSIDYRPPTTLVTITNTAGTAAPGRVASGYGLVGLRERVAALGGSLRAGPAGAGAWQLTARIPHPTSTEPDGSSS
ncbi:sensor histidine kinase [Streptomyces xiamenensis]|uniref:sensor histidine kinase n=1 Tax=Streptomyces xiamenensis TaxID=408015 RepID=UPI003D724BD1